MAIAAGQIIRALDFPEEQSLADPTTISNITETTPTLGDPVVAVTIVAPTTGKIKIQVGGGARDNGGTNRLFFEAQVRESGQGGPIVFEGTTSNGAAWGSSPNASNYMYGGSSIIVIPGLTPGLPYWVAVTYRVSGGSTADLFVRTVYAAPAT